jgi:predicted nucleic acid-binding protein
MSARSFFDSNILVYTDDTGAPEKQEHSLDLLERCRIEQSGVVSTQVLQEYFVTSTKKLKVSAEVARRKTELFGHFNPPVAKKSPVNCRSSLELPGFAPWNHLAAGFHHG